MNPLNNKPFSPKYEELKKFWTQLPVYKKINTILESINNNQVILILSSTGSGKSLLIPSIILSYFNYSKKIIMTLPKQIITKSTAQFTSEILDVNLGEEIGYQYKGAPKNSKSSKTKILYMTDGSLTSILSKDPLLKNYDCVIIDEAHEMSINIVLLIYLLRSVINSRPEFKLIIMSATVNTEIFSSYFNLNKFEVIDVGGSRNFEIKSHFLDKSLDYNLILETGFKILVSIISSDQKGDIIFFVTSSNEAFTICKMLAKYSDNNKKDFKVYCVELYANMNPEKQNLAQDKDLYKINTNYTRKVVISTNVAESSLTIDGVKFVIDCGYELSSSFDPVNRARNLDRIMISQAQAKQRMGRAGRTEAGTCYHLYTRNDFENNMKKYPEPDIQNSDITGECLRLLNRVGDLDNLLDILTNLIEVPKEVYINTAVSNLIQLGLMEKDKITNLGMVVNSIPENNLFLSLVVLYGKLYNCSREVMKIGALLEVCKGNINELFVVPDFDNKNLVGKYNKAKDKFADSRGDHLSLLDIFEKFNEYYNKNKDKLDNLNKWGYDRFLKVNNLIKGVKNYRNNKRNFDNIIVDYKYLGINYDEDINKMVVDDRVLICFLLGFRLNTAVKISGKDIYKTQYVRDKNIGISKSSFLNSRAVLPSNVFYNELFCSMGKYELVGVSYISKEIMKILG